MPILQNKIVWKSIKALHEEAVASMPKSTTNPIIANPSKKPVTTKPINDKIHHQITDDDVMDRIDKLLQKLDEDEELKDDTGGKDVLIADENKSRNGSVTNQEVKLETNAVSEDQTLNEKNSIERPSVVEEETEAKLDISLSETLEHQNKFPTPSTEQISSDEIIPNPAQDKNKTLADIAATIKQAQENSQNLISNSTLHDNYISFDTDTLTKAISDEVRETVSTVLADQLPNLVRQAVGDALIDAKTKEAKKVATTAKKTRRKASPSKKITKTKKAPAKKAVQKKV